MHDEMFGKPMFSQEELDEEKKEEEERKRKLEEKLRNGFFQHGISRRIVIENFTETNEIGKTSGKPWKKPTYWLRDVETGQTEVVDMQNAAFEFRNGFHDIKHELGTSLRLGVTVFEMMVEENGEKEFNGIKSPIWKFSFTLVSNEAGAAKAPEDKPVDTSGIPF